MCQAWGLGFAHCGELTVDSAQYIAGYVVKKLTASGDPRLAGKHPEFARMSLRPGIGAGFAERFAESLNSSVGSAWVASHGDVPVTARTDGRELPLGRYLRRKFRQAVGFDHDGGQATTIAQQQAEMQLLLDDSGLTRKQFAEQKPFIETQRILQMEGRSKIYRKKGVI